ncbi:MAG: hypothetical protein PHO83_07995 [Geobacteraceae bacterium]|nr:hypothetical protein [Geobacteraceae bacterium]
MPFSWVQWFLRPFAEVRSGLRGEFGPGIDNDTGYSPSCHPWGEICRDRVELSDRERVLPVLRVVVGVLGMVLFLVKIEAVSSVDRQVCPGLPPCSFTTIPDPVAVS